MHMSDALVSPTVAGVAGIVSVALLVVAAKRVRGDESRAVTPLMGVMGAFVFAAQMINFTIPGTGSSGHIVGGILLAALLGPWAAFITLASVLIIQCLVFADGGLIALGCNILNMGVCTCLIAYPLVYKPIVGKGTSSMRLTVASVLACVAGLLLGALAVSVETVASGITALPFGKFLLFMLPIHLLIGIGEGLATAVVLAFVGHYRPALLQPPQVCERRSLVRTWILIGVAALLVGGLLRWTASTEPDGLEWAVEQTTAGQGVAVPEGDAVYELAETIQHETAVMPDYEHLLAGLVGCLLVLALVYVVTCGLCMKRLKTDGQ